MHLYTKRFIVLFTITSTSELHVFTEQASSCIEELTQCRQDMAADGGIVVTGSDVIGDRVVGLSVVVAVVVVVVVGGGVVVAVVVVVVGGIVVEVVDGVVVVVAAGWTVITKNNCICYQGRNSVDLS